MLDAHTYRLSQSLARRQIPNWHLAQFHVVMFDGGPFPHDTQSVSELWQLMDTMQEQRFSHYMRQMNGLSREELNLLVDALTDIVIFQRSFMPDVPARIPFSTMMSALALYVKLRTYHPNFRSVLEVGPGCGYLSLFLKSHKELKSYFQSEACESFYLLQNAINTYAFPGRFEERAFPEVPRRATKTFTTDVDFIEEIDTLDDPFPPKCTHLPWWRLGDLATGETQFDIVTANAILREMHPQALIDYLEVIKRVMKPDGVMICQCLGFPCGTPDEKLREMLFNAGLAPLAYCEDGEEKILADSSGGEQRVYFPGGGLGVFVREGHPLFKAYYHRENYNSNFLAGEEFILRGLSPGGNRNFYRKVEILEMVKVRLESRLAD